MEKKETSTGIKPKGKFFIFEKKDIYKYVRVKLIFLNYTHGPKLKLMWVNHNRLLNNPYKKYSFSFYT